MLIRSGAGFKDGPALTRLGGADPVPVIDVDDIEGVLTDDR